MDVFTQFHATTVIYLHMEMYLQVDILSSSDIH